MTRAERTPPPAPAAPEVSATRSVSRTKEEEGLVGGERIDTSDEEDSSFDVID